jgi:hypothetical protein
MTFKKLVHKHIKTRCKNHFRLALRFGSRYSGIVISDEHRSIRKTAVGAAVFAFWGVLKAGLLLLFSERDVLGSGCLPIEMGRAWYRQRHAYVTLDNPVHKSMARIYFALR